MEPTIRILVEEASQIAETRRVARRQAEIAGYDEVRAEEVAIVATEAATNILKHAGRGEILINVINHAVYGGAGLEILALDRANGIDNLERCLADGYSTGSSPGQGLGAIYRLSTFADIYTVAGKGAAVLSRSLCQPAPVSPSRDREQTATQLAIGAVNLAKDGQAVCGDSWGSEQDGRFLTILVADGLGHGYDAHIASREAVRILQEKPSLEPKPMLELVHLALRSSRGAAVAVARIDLEGGFVSFAGVGNISAQIYSGSRSQQHLVSSNGTAGHHVHTIREFRYPWPEQGILILHSDGLVSATGLEASAGLALRDPSLIAGVLYRDYCRGNDDATVVVVKAV